MATFAYCSPSYLFHAVLPSKEETYLCGKYVCAKSRSKNVLLKLKCSPTLTIIHPVCPYSLLRSLHQLSHFDEFILSDHLSMSSEIAIRFSFFRRSFCLSHPLEGTQLFVATPIRLIVPT